MSGQKPKQQQASLFSFFKKPVNDTNTKSATEGGTVATAPSTAEKKAPISSGNVDSAKNSKAQSPVKSKQSPSPIKAAAPISTEEKDSLLNDTDDESFALGKKRRLQKGPKEQNKPESDSASKKPKLSNKSTPASATKKATQEKKKGTIHSMDDDDEDAEFESSSGEEDGSNFSDQSEEDDSSMDVDEDDEESLDPADDDSDDGNYRRKKVKAAATKKTARSTAASKKTVTKLPPTTTPSKAAPSLPSSAYKTPTGKTSSAMSGTFSGSAKTPDQMSQASAPNSASKIALPEGVMGAGRHDHDSYSFLFPENIRDANNRRPGEPCYNPRTLKLPPKFLAEQTPAMAQWWQFKAQNMDTVLFFKVGKFYELFHMDADIGYNELDLIYMKGTKAHSGFPEVSYGKFASILVSKGYRVARVEQTETPDMLKERNAEMSASKASGQKKDKVVLRELCSIMTKGTRTYNHMDDLTLLTGNGEAVDANASSLLLCICEHDYTQADAGTHHFHTHGAWTEYGLCIIDTIVSTITMAQFQDDRQRTRLRTFLARFGATEVLLEDAQVSEATLSVLQLVVPTAAKEFLRVVDVKTKKSSEGNIEEYISEMPSASKTLRMLENGQYFPVKATDTDGDKKELIYPSVISMLKEAYETSEQGQLALRALGGCLWQLKRSRIDHEIVSMGVFDAYVPPDDHLHDMDIAAATNEDMAMDVVTEEDGQQKGEGEEGDGTTSHNTTSFFAADDVIDLTSSYHLMDEDDVRNHSLPHHKYLSAIAPVASSVMILDETTLSNLEILQNTFDRSEKHSLWHFINHALTPGGKRLLKSWLCHPLYSIYDIALRQEAIQSLLSFQESGSLLIEKMRKSLRSVPDLERLLLRVHSNGLKKKHVVYDLASSANSHFTNTEHPDHRAVMFESQIYTLRKIRDFADILTGLEVCVQMITVALNENKTNDENGCWKEARLLQYLLAPTQSSCSFHHRPLPGDPSTDQEETVQGTFPLQEVTQQLAYFRDIFDEKQAKKEGQIKPKPGVNVDYDAAVANIANLHKEMESYLKEMKRTTNISDISYFGTGKDRFQLEIPMSQTSKVPSNWQSKSQKKTHRRYWTPFIEEKVATLLKEEDNLVTAQQDTLRQLFAKFDQHHSLWRRVSTSISVLDALLSLTRVSQYPDYCWPEIVPAYTSDEEESSSADKNNGVCLKIVQGRHPMLEQTLLEQQQQQQSGSSSNFIPNSLQLGGKQPVGKDQFVPRTMVLTGPNMGGKSTLLRTTCLLTLLGQLGCKIPASSCVFTPVDRIFTRLGASDKLLAGQSTFFVELAETSLLLRASTKHSLCILDELGRGTATFDGTAIAHSVLEYLVSMKKCRVLFATHYHLLVDEWVYDPRVQMGHMDCLVQTKPLPLSDASNASSSEDMVEEVTFLYRLCAGSSPKSYGINVARLAGLPLDVIRMALAEAAKFTQPSLAATATTSTATTSTTAVSETHTAHTHAPHHHHDVRHFAAYRIMTLLMERLVSLAQTHVPNALDHKVATKRLLSRREHDQAVSEMVAHAQELYARYQHLYQHHHIDDLLALS